MTHKILKTKIEGVFELLGEEVSDNRGSFMNLFRSHEQEFEDVWSGREISQINRSSTKYKGTIRGLHFQREPFSEAKIVRCLSGKVWDVAVDLRKHSKTFKEWVSVQLTDKLFNGIVIPEGCAHGFQTLEDNCELIYIHSKQWVPDYEDGIIWNDKDINIKWPLPISEISKRDKSLKPYDYEI